MFKRQSFYGEAQQFETTRRGFLKIMGVGAGAGLALQLPSVQASQQSAAGQGLAPNAFIRIGTDNSVIVVAKHLEMGQGTYTGMATLVAEELEADWAQVQVESAPADAARYKNLFWGVQGTGGSSGLANSFMQMREAGAAAKMMLVAAAAERWQVPKAQIEVNQGRVSHPGSGRSANFGELADAAAKQPVPTPEQIKLKDPSQFKLISRAVSRKDRGKNNGKARYTQDVQLEGMLTAVVAHPPRFGAKVASVDASAVKKMQGVVDVVTIPSGVAVIATDFWRAKTARDQLQVEWDESEAFTMGSDELMAQYRELAQKQGKTAAERGDVIAALGEQRITSEFEFPYLAHAAMEPMNCVAKVTAQGCEIWNGDQMQTSDQMTVAAVLGFKPEQVQIHTQLAGGSFGRRANPLADYVLEAVNIAKARLGVPVKLVWTREDDTRAGYFRPMYLHKMQASLDGDGKPHAWYQHIVGQSIMKGTPFEGFAVKDGIDGTSVEGARNLPYAIEHLQVELTTPDIPVPVLWWRSVGHTHTAYASEVFLDQLAHKGGHDPYALRRNLLQQHPRHLGVLELAAKKADWGKPLPEGWYRGIAVHESFRSFVAQVAEVSVAADGSFKVERVVCAVDCGIAVNPDIVKAQMEGGIGYGLSAALSSEITLEAGRVVQSNFHDYRVLRLSQMPQIEVHIVPSAEAPTGVGEPATPVIAPAVANALMAATGKVFTKLPLPQKV
ncbi:MAG: molybdopterin cofactor-binding domain-containing protein [Pseudomonadales bacterium]